MPHPKKRAVKDVPIFADKIFADLKLIEANFKVWNYKTQPEHLTMRDKALFAALILIGPRASETKLQKKQFLIQPQQAIVVNVATEKHGDLRKQIILPRIGSLAQYTECLVDWLNEMPEPEAYLFPRTDAYGSFDWTKPIGRKRIWQIIKASTGLFPHWFRGVHETIYGRLVFKNDAWKLKEHMGLKRLDSTADYVRGEMEAQDKQRLNML